MEKLPKRLQHLRKIVAAGRPARWVYVIQCGEFIKIGIADDVQRRIGDLQVGNPMKLTLLRKFKAWDAARMERELHEKLGSHHERGEWFRLSDVVKAWVDSI